MSILNETLMKETIKQIYYDLDEDYCYCLDRDTRNTFEQCFMNDDEIVNLDAEDEDYFKAVDDIKENLAVFLFGSLDHDGCDRTYLDDKTVTECYERCKELAKKNLA